MKKLVLSFALILGMLGITTQKSHAAIGALVSAPAVVSVGGVMALASMAGFGISSAVVLSRAQVTESIYATSILTILITPVTGLLGLVILDGEQQGEIAFTAASIKTHGQFSKDEIATYNKELPKLNAIQQTVSTEVAKNSKLDVNARWEKLGTKLSPATIEIAAFNGSELMKNIKTK